MHRHNRLALAIALAIETQYPAAVR